MRNLKLAFRTLAKTPFVTTIAVLSLALGIGANAAIFSLFDQMLLRPLPVREPARLVNLAAPGTVTNQQLTEALDHRPVIASLVVGLNDAGMTPTIVCGVPLSRTVCPMTAGSPPKVLPVFMWYSAVGWLTDSAWQPR